MKSTKTEVCVFGWGTCLMFLAILTSCSGLPTERGSRGDVALENAVVKIEATVGGIRKTGTGFIVGISADAIHIATAAHVVEGDDEPFIRFYTRRNDRVKGEVVQSEKKEDMDIAYVVVRDRDNVSMKSGITWLEMDPSDDLTGGEELRAIGFPEGGGDWAVTVPRFVSRVGARIKLQPAMDSGNSGSPVLKNGKAVGIVTDTTKFATAVPARFLKYILEGWDAVLGGAEVAVASGKPVPEPPGPSSSGAPKPEPSPVLSAKTEKKPAFDWGMIPAPEAPAPKPSGAPEPAPSPVPSARPERIGSIYSDPFFRPVLPRCEATLKPGTVCSDILKGTSGFRPEMVVVPKGLFIMGSPDTEVGRNSHEGPTHLVFIGFFALSRNEVTVGEFRKFAEAERYQTDAEKSGGCYEWDGKQWRLRANRNWREPGFKQRYDEPVVCVSWNDARAFAQWVSKQTGKAYRLPTEEEWEYAARGETLGARYWGENPSDACHYANVADRAAKRQASNWLIHECDDGYVYTAPGGRFKANTYGLEDMLGNVSEWTEDCWHENYTGASTVGFARADPACLRRVIRGGSWIDSPSNVRSAARNWSLPAFRKSFLGFRLARDL